MRPFCMLVLVTALTAVLTIGTWGTQTARANDDQRVFLPLVVRPPTAPTLPPVPTVSNNFAVSSASYVGDNGDDALNGVAIAPDGTIVLAGTLPGYAPVSPRTLAGGTSGTLVRLTQDGSTVLSVTRLGTALNDVEINSAGALLTCGDLGVARLTTTADRIVWQDDPGTGTRCAIGADGTAAVLVGDTITSYAADGTVLGAWQLAGSRHNDVAVAGAEQLVIATGYTQVAGNLQLPYIRAFQYDGTLAWRSYDFNAAPGLGADSRGERVAIGADGNLYFAGSINGGTGASVFARDPKDIAVRLGSDRKIETDQYNTPSNVGSVKMTWYGRYNPTDGTLVRGQSLLTRLSSGRGNSISVLGITADARGTLYMVGQTSARIEERDARQVGGVTVGNYSGSEAFFLAVRADMQQRYIWTTFAAPGASAGGTPATAVATRNGWVALTATVANGEHITVQPFQPQPDTLPVGYVAAWQIQ